MFLATLQTPMTRRAAGVRALTLKHNNVHFFRWRTLQTTLEARIVAAQPKPSRYALVAK